MTPTKNNKTAEGHDAGSALRGPYRAWWKDAAVYQIYPSSFNDTNGDGIGDLRGVIDKIDYLKNLNIDVVWLSPIYKSPQKDMGYDISDYRDIDPRYGTLADVDELTAELHKREMKLVMDLVVNHTSDEHAWFKESRSSKDNPKKDWYIWKPPIYDNEGNRQPPNNWISVFPGPSSSAWEYDETRDEYYLHLFLPGQPDLNWEHLPVREAVYDLMKFWLDKEIDGFRMDVINLISKVQTFPDAPVTMPGEKYQSGMKYCANGPRMHEFLREMRTKVLDKYDTLTVGEMPWVEDPNEVLKAIGRDRGELDMIFQFDIVGIDNGDRGKFSPHKWHLQDLREVVSRWQNFMIDNGGWNALFDENHDQVRTVSRFVDRSATDKDYKTRVIVAKMLATFLVLQSGTIYVYQGQELGMRNCPKEWGIEEYKDIETLNYWNKILEERGGGDVGMSDVMEQVQMKARDNARTPMQWDGTVHGGFTTGKPWMRVNDEYLAWNASLQINDPNSVYSYWSKLLKFRKEYLNTIVYGGFEMLSNEDEAVIAYKREGDTSKGKETGETAAIVAMMNFQPQEVKWNLADGKFEKEGTPKVLLGNYGDKANVTGGVVTLRPFETVVFSGSEVTLSSDSSS